ncbi:SPOSA6832_02187, partial [Sporobolomyces salmonicolor]
MIDTHRAAEKLKQLAKDKGTNIFALLTEILDTTVQEQKVPFMSYLTKDMYLYPDLHGEWALSSSFFCAVRFFLRVSFRCVDERRPISRTAGNRSLLADRDMRGMHIGMQLDKNVSDLALRYYATGEAIALQTRQIIDKMNRNGHKIESIFMSGGLVKNRFLMSLIADICNVPVQLPYSHSASVVVGSAMLGAAAAEEAQRLGGPLDSQEKAEKSSYGMKEKLWGNMVRSVASVFSPPSLGSARTS